VGVIKLNIDPISKMILEKIIEWVRPKMDLSEFVEEIKKIWGNKK